MYDLKKYKVVLARRKGKNSESREEIVKAVSNVDAIYKCVRFRDEGWQVIVVSEVGEDGQVTKE